MATNQIFGVQFGQKEICGLYLLEYIAWSDLGTLSDFKMPHNENKFQPFRLKSCQFSTLDFVHLFHL